MISKGSGFGKDKKKGRVASGDHWRTGKQQKEENNKWKRNKGLNEGPPRISMSSLIDSIDSTTSTTSRSSLEVPSAPPTPPPTISTLHCNLVAMISSGDVEGVANLLCVEARIEDGTGRGISGQQQVTDKIREVCGKVKGLVINPNANNAQDNAILMRSGVETRGIMRLKKGMIKLTIGIAAKWFGNQVILLVLKKGAGDDFVIDDTEPQPETDLDHDSATAASPTDHDPPRNRSRSVLPDLDPPYLVPRPPAFPPPTVTISRISLTGLANAPHALRPLNPYVRIGGRNLKAPVRKLTKDPTWELEWTVGVGGDGEVEIEIVDWKPVKHRLLGIIVVSVGSIPGQETSIKQEVDMRWSPGKTAGVELVVRRDDVEGWWRVEEMKARDRAREEGMERDGETEGEKESSCTVS